MKGFQWVILIQAIYFSIGVIISITILDIKNSILKREGLFIEIGCACVISGCIALRLAIHFQNCIFTMLVLIGLYTTGLTLIGSELAVHLQNDYDITISTVESNKNESGTYRGQMAIYIGCGVMLITFILIQFHVFSLIQKGLAYFFIFDESQQSKPNTETHTNLLHTVGLQSGLLVILLSGVCLIILDDKEWDSRYALIILGTLIISVYLNVISAWVSNIMETSTVKNSNNHNENSITSELLIFLLNQPMSSTNQRKKMNAFHLAFHLASLIVLQPLLFAENWIFSCLIE
jgi:hypothetical protein